MTTPKTIHRTVHYVVYRTVCCTSYSMLYIPEAILLPHQINRTHPSGDSLTGRRQRHRKATFAVPMYLCSSHEFSLHEPTIIHRICTWKAQTIYFSKPLTSFSQAYILYVHTMYNMNEPLKHNCTSATVVVHNA